MPKVPSSKPRVQCYITEELRAALDQIAEDNHASLSEIAASALEAYVQSSGRISVALEPDALAMLTKLSRANYRAVDDQVRMIVMEWIKSQTGRSSNE